MLCRQYCTLVPYLYLIMFTTAFADTSIPNPSEPEQTVSAQTDGTVSQEASPLFADVPRTSPFSIEEYDQLILKMHIGPFNTYWFVPGEWRQESDTCWVEGSDDEVISPYQFKMVKQAHYYRYKNTHPLDPAYYNQAERTVQFLQRFCFFRMTGKTLLPTVNIYLFALDMHTGLIFCYALPISFNKVFGHLIPIKWVPVEEHPYVREHFPNRQFYELDPFGFIQEDGKIILYDWIIQQSQLKAGDILNYLPHLDDYEAPASPNGPGYSPYKRNTK